MWHIFLHNQQQNIEYHLKKRHDILHTLKDKHYLDIQAKYRDVTFVETITNFDELLTKFLKNDNNTTTTSGSNTDKNTKTKSISYFMLRNLCSKQVWNNKKFLKCIACRIFESKFKFIYLCLQCKNGKNYNAVVWDKISKNIVISYGIAKPIPSEH